jgi:hypothetical protein
VLFSLVQVGAFLVWADPVSFLRPGLTFAFVLAHEPPRNFFAMFSKAFMQAHTPAHAVSG